MIDEQLEVYLRLPYPPVSGNHQHHHNSDGSKTLKQEVLRYRAQVNQVVVGYGYEESMFGSDGAPLWVEWNIHPPSGTRDVDNFRKVLADALTKAKFWVDDAGSVLRLEVFRWFDPVPKGDAWVDLWLRSLPEDEQAIERLTGEEGGQPSAQEPAGAREARRRRLSTSARRSWP